MPDLTEAPPSLNALARFRDILVEVENYEALYVREHELRGFGWLSERVGKAAASSSASDVRFWLSEVPKEILDVLQHQIEPYRQTRARRLATEAMVRCYRLWLNAVKQSGEPKAWIDATIQEIDWQIDSCRFTPTIRERLRESRLKT